MGMSAGPIESAVVLGEPSFGPRGRHAEISYAIVESRLGRMLVGATAAGICMVSFGDSAARLVVELRADYPEAVVRRDDEGIKQWTGIVFKAISDGSGDIAAVLDIRGTPFQRQVWRALINIPAGETRSYGDIARRLGRNNGARAVGRAIASNPVSVLIPCHRAIGTDGKLHGYRWGLARKKTLLAMERARACPPPPTRR